MTFWNGTHWVAEPPSPTSPERRGRGRFTYSVQAGLTALLILGLTAGTALAAKGGNRSNSSSIELVMVTDGLRTVDTTVPQHGDTVSFTVTTTTTSRPYVLLNCYQGDAWVYAAQAGFWADYPWGQDFILSATSWPDGGASCTARLGSLNADGTKFRELARTSFDVAP